MTFEEAAAAAQSLAELKSAMLLVNEPRKHDFVQLMRGMGESERIAKVSGTTPQRLIGRLARVDPSAAAMAERLNLNIVPAFIRALATVLPKEQP